MMNLMFQPLRKYANFQGRASRSEYWLFFLFTFIVSFSLQILMTLMGGALSVDPATGMPAGPSGAALGLAAILGLFSLAMLVPNLAVGVRRLHDTNRSGWWLLIALIPLIGAVVLLIFFVIDSTPGDNRFGPNPKAGTESFA